MFVGDAYYRRKVPNYNFTTYDLATTYVKCFVWNETEAKYGSCEISTCIYVYNKEAGEMNEVIFIQIAVPGSNELWSPAQCTKLPIDKITHNSFERGHSQIEGDSVHAIIKMLRNP